MVRADVAVGVGRHHAAAERVEVVLAAQPGDVDRRRRHARENQRHVALNRAVVALLAVDRAERQLPVLHFAQRLVFAVDFSGRRRHRCDGKIANRRRQGEPDGGRYLRSARAGVRRRLRAKSRAGE